MNKRSGEATTMFMCIKSLHFLSSSLALGKQVAQTDLNGPEFVTKQIFHSEKGGNTFHLFKSHLKSSSSVLVSDVQVG